MFHKVSVPALWAAGKSSQKKARQQNLRIFQAAGEVRVLATVLSEATLWSLALAAILGTTVVPVIPSRAEGPGLIPIYIEAVSYLGTLVIMACLGILLLPIREPLVIVALLSSTLGGRYVITLSFTGGFAESLGSFVAILASGSFTVVGGVYVMVLHGLMN